ncbi:MAG: phosphate signaling complex protein PhoU [Rhodospirillaceae bacterium]
MSNDHIVKSFDNDLRRLDYIIAEMGGIAEVQIADAIDALVKRDAEKAERVIERDQRIDDLETELDEFATTLLALRQPVANDLRVVISALKTAAILERVGDYAKNIAKRTIALSQTALVGPTKTIVRMARLVQSMIKNVLDAYVRRDVQMALDVRNSDVEVDALHTSLFRELLTYMMEDPRVIGAGTHLLFVAKNIERIGDHATNIAKNVHVLVHGDAPQESRRKGDTSSYTMVHADRTTETAT